jgi:hypothetical protein
MKKTTRATFGVIGFALFSGALTAKAEVESLLGGEIEGEISTGYDSRYFFRGLWFGDETAWTNLEYSKKISSNLTAKMNLFYTEVIDDQTFGGQFSYSEGNVGVGLSYDAGYGTFDLGFLHYRFYDGFGGTNDKGRFPGAAGNGDANELNLAFSKEIWGGIDFHALVAYDFRIDGSYAEVGFAKGWQLCDVAGLEFSVTTGYSINDYYSTSLSPGDGETDFTHTLLSLAMPIQFTDNSTLTPHVSANITHGAHDDTNNAARRGDTEVFFGASFAVSF